MIRILLNIILSVQFTKSIIGIVIFTSPAYIHGNICLNTAVRFMNGQYGCHFRFDQADTVLKDGATCTDKCNVQMVSFKNQYAYYLREVHVTIGTEQTFTQSICQPSHTRYEPMDMYITCSSWNKDKYRVNVIDTSSCRLRNAQCERIGNYCICHCFRKFIVVNGSCLKGNVMFGHPCLYGMQCTGTEFASLCQYGQCKCQSGYSLIGYNCYPGNVTVGHYCSYNQQCTGTEFASVCNNSRCECQSGYILIRNNCYQGNVTIGKWCVFDVQCTGTQRASLCQNGLCSCRSGFVAYHNNCILAKNVTVRHLCLFDWQCTGTQFARFCHHYQCECQPGYILIDNNCYPEHVTVGHPCSYQQQCTGTEYASVCNNDRCECQSGYILNRNNCYQDHVPVGGLCSVDIQCTGSKNSETCDNGRCRCSDGHILLDLECIQGNLSLNQSCTVHEQCSSSNYSRCVDEKCTCMEGYTAENLTSCINFQPNEFENSVRNQQDNNISKILGTLFGGMLIGVILTAVVAFLVFQKMRTKLKKKEEPSVSFANEALYSSAIVVEREDITGSQANDKKRKVVNVLPYACSEKGAGYSFVNRKPRVEQPTTEGVYNHLREQEKHDNEHDDNYDHACAASYIGTEPSVYSYMP